MHEQTVDLVSRIWEESRSLLKGFIKKRVGNEADAEDVLQKCFLQNSSEHRQARRPGKTLCVDFSTDAKRDY